MIGRISVLGGSSVYTPELLLSVISKNLNVKEICLVGRPGSKLPIVAKFCQRLVDKSGFPISIVAATDVAEGVRDAKYILNTVRVGGLQARLRDEKLPPRDGMVGDESLGAGGFANAMRTLPVMFEFAECIQEVNPTATFINLTNPTGIVVEALVKYSKLNVVGACDLPGTCVRRIAKMLHQDPSNIWVDYIGLNHMGWIQDVKVNGRSCMSAVLEKLERSKEDGFDLKLIELFRMIPTRTVSCYFHHGEIVKKQRSCSRFRAEALHEAEQQILKLYGDESLAELPELARERNAVWYDTTIVPLIEALEGESEREMILCVRNDGSVRDLPDDCSVEIPVRVSQKGLVSRKVGSFPRFLKGLVMSVKESDRLAVEAVRHKSYEFALQSLVVNPLVPSLEAARRFLDRIVKEEHVELH